MPLAGLLSSPPPCRIHKNLDLVLRLDLLLPQVDAAVQELYSRTGR